MADNGGERTELKFLKGILEQQELFWEYKDCIYASVIKGKMSSDIWKAINLIAEHKSYPLNLKGVEQFLKYNAAKLTSNVLEKWDSFEKLTLNEKPEFYCELMKKRSRQAKIASLSTRILSFADAGNVSECLDLIELQKEAILNIDAPEYCLMNTQELNDIWLAQQATIQPGTDGVIGVRTGFSQLDKITRGFKPGELIVIGARPSVGKSALMASMSVNILKHEPAAVFSLEMTNYELYSRMLSIESQLPLADIHNKRYSSDTEQEQLLINSMARFTKYGFVMNDKKTTVREIEVAIKRAKANLPELRVCFIDYIQIIQPSERFRSQMSNHQVIGEISSKLKTIAKELKMAVVVLSQLNRNSAGSSSGEDPRPVMSNLKESGNIEQDADIIILLHRRKPKEKEIVQEGVDIVDLHVEKNRNGRLGTVTCEHYKRWTLFRQYPSYS